MGNRRTFDRIAIGGAGLLCLLVAILNNCLVTSAPYIAPGSVTLTNYEMAVFGGLLSASRIPFIALLPYLASAIVPPVILGSYLSRQTGGYLYFTLIRIGDVVKWWRGIFLRSMCLIFMYALIQMLVNAVVFFASGNALQLGNEHPVFMLLSLATFVLYMAAICSVQLHIQIAHNHNPATIYLLIVALPIVSLGLSGVSTDASIWFPGSYGMSYRIDVIRQYISSSNELELEAGWNSTVVFLMETALIASMYYLTVWKLKKGDGRFAL